jgi:antitoxin component YwqK of YwqJK toxin-antitoxin module
MNWRHGNRILLSVLFGISGWAGCFGQGLRKFALVGDTAEFRSIRPEGDGFTRDYVPTLVQVYDLDADSTTYVVNRQLVLLCIEGMQKANKKEGLYSYYLIDDANHSTRYKIWEKTYINNKLDGQWKVFTLRGGLVRFQTYRNDSLNGISRGYWIDGKGIMDEREYFNGKNKFIQRTYFKNGKTESEMPYQEGKPNGTIKRYYETGTLQETQEMKNGRADGARKYYYSNGQLWIDQVYKAGKNWEVRANYTEKGQRRRAGTLRNGNGTMIFYNDDGTVREVKNFINGVAK